MATIYVDGKRYEIQDGQNLLQACIALGLNVPYFCWHPAIGSVGACRQCAVKHYRDENDKQGRLLMSCMTPATDGVRITLDDEESKAFRGSVIEWMMTNHPHDCPVCDEGGECHLQDMTLMTGHDYRSYRFEKRTFTNQDLGPLINHEMNRCIQCYRCVRYYKDYAGGSDLDAFASHNHVYFGRHEDGVLENEFSGNLVEVCPTGVFTDKTLKKHYTRRWDYTTAPSVCVHCSLGCNVTPGERYGEIRRIRNRYNHSVNGYFLCDRGRFGYEFINDSLRPKMPLRRRKGPDGEILRGPLTREQAMSQLAQFFRKGEKVVGIGSPRASVEANFALRVLIGAENFYQGVSKNECELLARSLQIINDSPAAKPSLNELKSYDAVFVLGEDLTGVAPMAALNVRQTVLNQPRAQAHAIGVPDWNDLAVRQAIGTERGPLYIAAPSGGRLDDAATETYFAAPDALARLGFAVAQAIDESAPAAQGVSEAERALAGRIAKALLDAKMPLVISGHSCGSMGVLDAAANIALALSRKGKAAGIHLTAPECNSLGMALIGGGSIEDAARAILNGDAATLVVLENDLYRRAERSLVDSMLSKAANVIVVDHTFHATAQRADVLLPAATFAEGDGTMVNNVGSAQRFMQVFKPDNEVTESWRWLRRIRTAASLGRADDWLNLDSFLTALAEQIPAFGQILELSPTASFRVGGQKIPRQSHRYSGRTAIHANVAVSETAVAQDVDSPMSFSMEGFQMMTPAALMSSFWTPGWNSAQAITRFQEEVNGPLEGGDPGVRLLGHRPDPQMPYFGAPAVSAGRDGTLAGVARFHMFGSEELSMLSPGIAQLAPKPYVMLHADDAAALGLGDGALVELTVRGETLRLPLSVSESTARGTAAIPAGLPGMPYLGLPSAAVVRKGRDA